VRCWEGGRGWCFLGFLENGGVAFEMRHCSPFSWGLGFGGLFCADELRLTLWHLLTRLNRTFHVGSRQLHSWSYKIQVEDWQTVMMSKRKHRKRRKANMAVPT